MKTTAKRNTLPLLIMAFWLLFIGLSFQCELACQDRVQLPARSGFVNDFAGVLDAATKQRLEVMFGKSEKAERY